MAKSRIPLDLNWEQEQKIKACLAAPIADLCLDVRITNTLEEDGLLWVHQLVQRKRESLLTLKNFGEISVQQIEKALKAKGLQLSQ